MCGRLYQSSGNSQQTRRFLYDGAQVIAEYDGAATPVLMRRYVHGHGVDESIVWYEGTGTGSKSWLIADERGSIVALTDGSGLATTINRYDEYGAPDAANAGRFGYTGQA